MALPYNPKDAQSIIEFAKQLKSKSLRKACDKDILAHHYSGKGGFGQLLERYYFQYEPNSVSEPDFVEAGLELKTSPLKKIKGNKYVSKERLVLNIINYLELVGQEFEHSSFWKKNAHLLLVFYLHKAEANVLDYVIKLVSDWGFPETDLEIIKKDWQKIKDKVEAGKAHELSEGDTFYLGACTKGGKGGNLRPQPNSKTQAKQRAYSLKQGYVNHIIASIANEEPGVYGKLIPNAAAVKEKSIEEIVISKFEPYYGLTPAAIQAKLGVELNTTAKAYLANLTKAILGVSADETIDEFNKAEVTIKTIRLKANNLPKESVSFAAFKFLDLARETWAESRFNAILEEKFLYVFFQYQGNELVLRKVKFWNMPYADRMEAKKVWQQTQKIVLAGDIVKEVKANGKRLTNFPSKKVNKVSHVRPHAQNAKDTYPLPIPDKVTGATTYTKQCFWLNDTYIRDEIYLK